MLEQDNTTSYTHDTNGTMLTGAGRTFTWNGENQPVRIVKTGTPTETYVYDGDNVRVKRTVASSPVVTSIYVGKVEYRGTQVISTYGGVASRTTTGNPTSSNLGTIVYMHSDHLGSVSMTTSATGTVAQTQEFDPWGAVKAGGITSVSYNYTGQRLDGTGLLFYNARYYDPQLARFTSADTIISSSKDPQTRNRYAYVLNNPLGYKDSTGHIAESFREPEEPDKHVEIVSAEIYKFILSYNYGISLEDGDKEWTLLEIRLVYQAVLDILAATGWDRHAFLATMGNTTIVRNKYYQGNPNYDSAQGWIVDRHRFEVYDAAHIGGFNRTIVHEFAHIWDVREDFRLSTNLARAIEEDPTDRPPTEYAEYDNYEDWAETFTTYVYPNSPAVNVPLSHIRREFVESEINRYK